MIIYQATKREFLNHVLHDDIEDVILRHYESVVGSGVARPQIHAWAQSLEPRQQQGAGGRRLLLAVEQQEGSEGVGHPDPRARLPAAMDIEHAQDDEFRVVGEVLAVLGSSDEPAARPLGPASPQAT